MPDVGSHCVPVPVADWQPGSGRRLTSKEHRTGHDISAAGGPLPRAAGAAAQAEGVVSGTKRELADEA